VVHISEKQTRPNTKLKTTTSNLIDLLTSFGQLTNKFNFFFSAGMIVGLHYESIMDIMGFCPVPVVCGSNRLGKTKSAKAALSLVGNMASFYSSVKERFIPRLCSRTTLPPVLDDIKKSKLIEEIAVSFYNRGKDGTCFLECTPRTCPIITVNWESLDALDRDPRYVVCYN